MKTRTLPVVLLIFAILAACDAVPDAATLTPTRAMSGPTTAPSATVNIQSSDELYGTGTGQVGTNNLTAAALPNNGVLPPAVAETRQPDADYEIVRIATESETVLEGALYQQGVLRVPGILLLGTGRAGWGTLPQSLMNRGLTVLVVDITMGVTTADVVSMLTGISEIGTVDPARIGVVGASDGADLALLGCASNAICDVAVLLSPINRDTLLNALISYNPRPLLVAAAANDLDSHPTAVALAASATSGTLVEYSSGHGMSLIQTNPESAREIGQWLMANINPD